MVLFALLGLSRWTMREVWSVAFPPSNVSFSTGGIALVGDRLLYTEPSESTAGRLGCLDARTGKPLWRWEGERAPAERLTVGGGHVVVRAGGKVWEVDPATGRTVWGTRAEPYRLGPFLEGDRLVVETAWGRLEAFDLRTHRALWTRDVPDGFLGKTGDAVACVAGGGIWAQRADGRVVGFSLADGRPLFERRFGGGKLWGLVPMAGAVALCGASSTEAWSTAGGRRLWRARGLPPGKARYDARRGELWTIPQEDGNLYRFRASDGGRVGQAIPLDRDLWVSSAPTSYGEGYAFAMRTGLMRLDGEGVPQAVIPMPNGAERTVAVGADVIVQTLERIVRLTPGMEPLPDDADARIARLVARPDLSRTELFDLERYGRRAVPAILAALPTADKRRRNTLSFVLKNVAEAGDTEALFARADAVGTFSGAERDLDEDYTAWMLYVSDPDVLARSLLPRLLTAKDDWEKARLVPFMTRSTDPAVVEALFSLLRSPSGQEEFEGAVYPALARSGRADVLEWIVRTRLQGRRLATAIPGLSTRRDRDGDGIPDAYDANPFVAPRELSETERVMAAAFDAFARADGRDQPLIDLTYGPGVRPFELVGWRGGLRPRKDGREREVGAAPGGLSFETLSADGNVVRFERGGTEAVTRIARRYGYGTEERLRKMRGEWFVVSLRVTWIN